MSDPIARLNEALEGRYAVRRELGVGGMATVYLADDLKHQRRVALKVLKPELAAVVGAERFLAEIQTTANLQHPHVLPLFDSGEADELLWYAMPYVEGETLRGRLDRERQLSVEEAVQIATNVAEALEYAHSRGVIHRDIKPENILLQAGKPVVSDFGIALAVGARGGGRLTGTGMSLGTPHYMSPEQATGEVSLGPGTDVYALGCVLYEMLVGEPPYTGSTPQAILGKIIQAEPVSARKARSSVPPNVDGAIRRALEKVPADRFGSARAFAAALADAGFRHGDGAGGAAGVSGAGERSWNRLTIATTVLAAVFALTTAWALLRPGPHSPSPPVERFEIPLPQGWSSLIDEAPMTLLPDGSGMVVAGRTADGEGYQYWLRRWNELSLRPVAGTDVDRRTILSMAAASPEGDELAFVSDRQLKVVSLSSEGVRTVADSVFCCPRWLSDGYLYFTGSSRGIDRVAPTGGAVESVIPHVEGDGAYSEFALAEGGDVAVFEVASSELRIDAVRLSTGERKTVTPGMRPHLAPGGELVFGSWDGDILAASFDVESLELTDAPVTLVSGVAVNAAPTPIFAMSASGTLLYAEGSRSNVLQAQLVWVTRDGEPTPVDPAWSAQLGSTSTFGWRLSPDGARIAISLVTDGNPDIWIKTLASGTLSRITFDPGSETLPRWRSDDNFVTFTSDASHIRVKRADGVGESQPLYADFGRPVTLGAWSPDGQWLLLRTYGRVGFMGARDILVIRPGTDSVPSPLVADPDQLEQAPAVSPDGRWLAYSSDETGREEVFVRTFPDVQAGKWQVSTEGGIRPLWSRSGRELFFVNPRTRELVSADLDDTSAFVVTGTRVLFTLPPDYLMSANGDFYDITPDDQRFLMGRRLTTNEDASQRLVLVQDWYEELRKRLGG